ncbi:pantoate--beta-alanine ligase [Defluviitalea phaphyphila]|uniref:pantoate--beta-alanine ligase n=1 Tax=Defluviitalea phaphyphila TaxID=1473580 RepID=UPI00073132F4|nr:pantoate--beta-alanine ligase [Defluviitalea phaphyphila]
MKRIDTILEMKKEIKKVKEQGKSIGFVPTMGFLHQGHESLIKKAKGTCDCVVVSIFVNPTQFGPGEDYEDYPRDLDRDLNICEKDGVDFVFAPSVKEMYPKGYNTFVNVEEITDILCGEKRPGHFRGVATVVTKFFNIIKPDFAFFGEKDYQQLIVIKQMVKDLNMDVNIVGCPIIREKDGLAKSSRNKYLNKEEREAATILYKALQKGKQLIGLKAYSISEIKERLEKYISSEPKAKIDYIEILNADTLEIPKSLDEKLIIALAVKIGKTRLIDNCIIGG